MTRTRRDSAMTIESATIEPIAADQRHGQKRDLFTIWFGANVMVLAIVTGALATTVFGQPAWSALLAIVLGNLVGAVFMALHSAQGPRLGVPQMVQTRGQFGTRGSVLILVIVVLMYLGFFVSAVVFGGASLVSVIPGLPRSVGIILVAAVGLAATMWGYQLIHAYARIMTYLCGAAIIVAFLWIFVVHDVPVAIFTSEGATLPGFLGAFSAAAVWQIAYAPYVSDYSRYLPAKTGVKPAFWMCYSGTTIGSVLSMALGATVGLLFPGADPVDAVTKATSGISGVVVALLSVGVAATAAMNLYCGTLSTITIAQTFAPGLRARAKTRAFVAVGFTTVALVIALTSGEDFLATYNDFLTVLLGSLVPWTAINLVDYCLIRHGDYEVAEFFQRDGGRYGYVNWPAVICYLLGIAVQIPFMIIGTSYMGPLARLLGGIDVSFLAGLVIVSPLYYFIATRRHERI